MKKEVALEQMGFEFSKNIVKLYESTKNIKGANDYLCEMLLEVGVHAGSTLACLCECSEVEADKIAFTKEALADVKRVEHYVRIMKETKAFKGHLVTDVLDMCNAIHKALTELNKKFAAQLASLEEAKTANLVAKLKAALNGAHTVNAEQVAPVDEDQKTEEPEGDLSEKKKEPNVTEPTEEVVVPARKERKTRTARSRKKAVTEDDLDGFNDVL